jgi:hypothetical protein
MRLALSRAILKPRSGSALGGWRMVPVILLGCCPGQVTIMAGDTDPFPATAEVLQGRTFQSQSERDVFFLQQIRQKYPEHWSSLLQANISVRDYEAAPEKLLRFIQELGSMAAGSDDGIAITNLWLITSFPVFYADPNAYRPEILRAAATALIGIGPQGRRALAAAFSESHYRTDPATLELLAEAIGHLGSADTNLIAALAATAFTLTATNGGSYPRCTSVATRVLARLPGGADLAARHLTAAEVFKDPGRFQAVIEGLADARAVELTNDLSILSDKAAAKLKTLDAYRGPYYDDLADLRRGITNALATLNQPPK